MKDPRTFGFCRTEPELELISPNPNFSTIKTYFFSMMSTYVEIWCASGSVRFERTTKSHRTRTGLVRLITKPRTVL